MTVGIVRRAVAVWALIALVETLHGALRTTLLAPAVGDLASRQIGVATGSVLILLIAGATSGWIGARDPRVLAGIGLMAMAWKKR